MKKCTILISVVLLVSGFAFAEPTTREIVIEGMTETITEMRAEGDGYAFSYDMERFAFYPNGVEEGVDLLVPAFDDAVSPVYMQIRAVDEDPTSEYTEEGFEEMGETTLGVSGLEATWLSFERSEVLYTTYLIPTGEKIFVLDIAYPSSSEVVEGFGARLQETVDTFEIVEAE